MTPSSVFSIDKLASASSPNRLRAHRLADKKSQSPERAASGVRQAMLVDFMMWLRYWRRSLGGSGMVSIAGWKEEGKVLRYGGADVDLVLPLELSPHASELCDSRQVQLVSRDWIKNIHNPPELHSHTQA